MYFMFVTMCLLNQPCPANREIEIPYDTIEACTSDVDSFLDKTDNGVVGKFGFIFRCGEKA
jgi:hypothetical protein